MALLVRLARLPRLLVATPDATVSLGNSGGPQLGRSRRAWWRHRALSTEATAAGGGEPASAPIAAIEPMMRASFVCQACSTRGLWTFKRRTYETGVVLVRCKSCDKMHLVADNLGWFRDEKTNLETLASEKGEKVLRAHDVQLMFDDSRLQESNADAEQSDQ